MTSDELLPPELERSLESLIPKPITSFERIYGGGNNRIYRADCSDAQTYIVKFYPKFETNERDRLQCEFNALQFLWRNGIQSVPKPFACNKDLCCAVYEYIDGPTLLPESISEDDIDQAVRCLINIKELKDIPGSDNIPMAAEACVSINQIFENIHRRLTLLQNAPDPGRLDKEFRNFVQKDFPKALNEIQQWSASASARWGTQLSTELTRDSQTLSPSDFGFHNALRRPNGDLVFIDFEYFGWDDPAKMAADFLLHPGMELTHSMKNRFSASILTGFQENVNLAKRLTVVYPIFGLKWCLIILNEFLPEKLSRRTYASGEDDASEMQERQLNKARAMMERVLDEYQQLPYLQKNTESAS